MQVKLLNDNGDVVEQKNMPVKLEPYQRSFIPVSIELPLQNGGYAIVAEFIAQNDLPVISRRYIRVGEMSEYSYFEVKPE